MAKRPSRKQLRYLKNLGYAGMPPKTSDEAAAAIDVMQATRDARAAEQAIEDQRMLAAREQIKAAVVANLGTGPSCLGALLKISFLAALVAFGVLAIQRAGRDVKQAEPEAPGIRRPAENTHPPQVVERQPVDDEKRAQTELAAARAMMSGNKQAAQARLRNLIAKYPSTQAAAAAAALLK